MDERVINILLVEDDEVDVMTVKRAFQKANISNPLYVAHNGLEALDILRKDDRVEAYRLNVAGYLLKPVTFQQFAEVMSTINKYWALMEMP